MDPAFSTLLARLQANMYMYEYLLYREVRKGKKIGVVVQSVEPSKMTAKNEWASQNTVFPV